MAVKSYVSIMIVLLIIPHAIIPVATENTSAGVRSLWTFSMRENFGYPVEEVEFTITRNSIFDGKISSFITDSDPSIAVLSDISSEVMSFLENISGEYLLLYNLKMILLPPLPASILYQIAQFPSVEMIHHQGILEMQSDVAVPAIKAGPSELYSPESAWELGYFGRGISVAIMDTGVDSNHPSLKGKFIGGVDFTKPDTPLTPRDGSFNPDDVQGHGTTCAGITMGTGAPEGMYKGTAPEAMLIDIRIGDRTGYAPGERWQSFYDASLLATEWAIEFSNYDWPGTPLKGIDILSLSWSIDVGYSSDGTDPYSMALNRLVDAGVNVVAAASNDGPNNDGFKGMGAGNKVITVGATDDKNTIDRSDDVIARYSNRGPRAPDSGNPVNMLKPDVSAPGTNINQAIYEQWGDGSNSGYGHRGSGTSYATPAVAGVIAMMLEANPSLPPAVVKEILRATAERRGEPTLPDIDPFWNRDFGWGMVDAYRAVKLAKETINPSIIDINLQAFITNITEGKNTITVSGIAFSREGSIGSICVIADGVEYVLEETGKFVEWTLEISKGAFSTNEKIEISVYSNGGSKRSLHHSMDYTFNYSDEPRDSILSGAGGFLMPALLILIAVPAAVYYVAKKKNYRFSMPARLSSLGTNIKRFSPGDMGNKLKSRLKKSK